MERMTSTLFNIVRATGIVLVVVTRRSNFYLQVVVKLIDEHDKQHPTITAKIHWLYHRCSLS